MSGAAWALLAGLGFGLFQTLNRRAVDRMDVYFATFVQLVVSALVLAGIALLTVDVRPLFTAPSRAILNFAAAGFFHFFIGWTFLNASQKSIGAARTSPLIGTTPLFATLLGAVALGEIPQPMALFGIGLIVAGAFIISRTPAQAGPPESLALKAGTGGPWLGLSAACCWAVSPLFIRAGLQDLASPLLGVTVGAAVSAVGYGIVLLFQRRRWAASTITAEAWSFKLAAGLLVGLSTWMRWIALDLAPIAIVLAITMVSMPLVMWLSPMVSGKHLEQVTGSVWAGAAAVLGGALLLTFIA